MKKTFVTLAAAAALVAATAPVVTSALDTNTTSKITVNVGHYSPEYQQTFTQLKAKEAELEKVNAQKNNTWDAIQEKKGDIAVRQGELNRLLEENKKIEAQLLRDVEANPAQAESLQSAAAATVFMNNQLADAQRVFIRDAENVVAELEGQYNGLLNQKATIEAEITALQEKLNTLAGGQVAPEAGAAAPAGNGPAANGKPAAKPVAAAKTGTGSKTLPKTSAAK
ncbi:hypothetical protein ACHBGV_10175 [Streptococcus sp. A34]|uniref:hypothetical protein n=1 Tax=Streptococcus sp. A34 TaxID=3373130 RepID=UPI00374D6940